ncbi:S-adenosyl-L-methionine-dependent methyltransferase [Mycena capillaripes]|nr:S-adenosyl-L-methionine-dependent methyltransferase [Mycena capillaripes]
MSDSEPEEQIELDALTDLGEQLIYSILAEEPLDTIKQLIESGAPLWYQTDSEGARISSLHAAAYVQNRELVKLLIEGGAVWNAVDYLRNTAGDIALSFNNDEIYTIIRDAGIRAELLLALLSSRSDSGSALILRPTDDTAAASTDAFLSSKLRFTVDDHGQDICMLDVEGGEFIGVMMGWERAIMQETVTKLTVERTDDLKILNVGFGLGIIDTLFQSLSPTLHVIIEAHPDVLKHMKELGWYEKPGVKILEGKWQDFINTEQISALVPDGGFDIVYTDSFSEDYQALRGFFSHLPVLLGPRSKFSFFNGLGATNATIYDVYTRVAEVHLADVGFNVKWSDVDVSEQRNRWGNSRPYFTCPTYRLPLVVRN